MVKTATIRAFLSFSENLKIRTPKETSKIHQILAVFRELESKIPDFLGILGTPYKSDAPCGAMYAFGTLRIHLNFYKVRMNGEADITA